MKKKNTRIGAYNENAHFLVQLAGPVLKKLKLRISRTLLTHIIGALGII